MKSYVEVKNVSVSALRLLAMKARLLADAIDMELAAATSVERSRLAIVTGALRRHEVSFKRYAENLGKGSLPPKRTLSDMQWIAERINERIRRGQPTERPDAHAFATRKRTPKKSGALSGGR